MDAGEGSGVGVSDMAGAGAVAWEVSVYQYGVFVERMSAREITSDPWASY